jgi:hypothetical protein
VVAAEGDMGDVKNGAGADFDGESLSGVGPAEDVPVLVRFGVGDWLESSIPSLPSDRLPTDPGSGLHSKGVL